MKYRLSIILIIFSFYASAQQKTIEQVLEGRAGQVEPGLPVNEVINHIGSQVYVVDTIYKYKIINDTTMYLYVGGSARHQLVTIIIKGTTKQLNVARREDWTHGLIHVSGMAVIYKNKPAIVVTSGNQFGTRIEI